MNNMESPKMTTRSLITKCFKHVTVMIIQTWSTKTI